MVECRLLAQLVLLEGCYRCDYCGHDVDHVLKERRWHLCDECWAAIVEPACPGEIARLEFGDELWHARERYWIALEDMERRHSHGHRESQRRPAALVRTTDSYYPWCACGRLREPLRLTAGEPGLWGGPFASLCPECEGKAIVSRLYEMAPRLVPGRDEEEWLDLLLRSHPELFERGILPDYWFELKLKEASHAERP